MPIQRSLRIRRTHSFDALRCAESSKRLLKISVICLIPMFRRPPVIVVFAPSRLRTLNEVNFKQHDKGEVIGTKVNGSPCSTPIRHSLGWEMGLGSTELLPPGRFLLRCMSPLLAQSGHFSIEFQCPLLGVKRTSDGRASMSGFDPKAT